MSYTITQAHDAFCRLDRENNEAENSVADKLLRHLTQRHYFPPEGRIGRADVYSIETICALRLVQKASVFGMDRWQIETLTRFLNTAPKTAPGRTKTLIREAVERAETGEEFSLSLVMYASGQFVPETDWKSKTPESDAKIDAIFEDANVSLGKEDCRFTLAASRLVSEVFSELSKSEG